VAIAGKGSQKPVLISRTGYRRVLPPPIPDYDFSEKPCKTVFCEASNSVIAVYGKAKSSEIHLPEPFKAEHLLRLSWSHFLEFITRYLTLLPQRGTTQGLSEE